MPALSIGTPLHHLLLLLHFLLPRPLAHSGRAIQLGLLVDLTSQGMGLRCKRFMCVVEGGVVTHTSVGDKVELVSATAVENALSEAREGPRRGGLFEKLLGREVEARAAETEASESGDLLPVRNETACECHYGDSRVVSGIPLVVRRCTSKCSQKRRDFEVSHTLFR